MRSFPTFYYSKQQWLDLCDGYANAFLCGGFEPFQHCISDSFVLFANTYLGYTCSPQNVQSFLHNAQCVNKVALQMAPQCEAHIRGTVNPNQTPKQRCNVTSIAHPLTLQGISDYYTCVNEQLLTECGAEAVAQFEQVVEQIGCQL